VNYAFPLNTGSYFCHFSPRISKLSANETQPETFKDFEFKGVIIKVVVLIYYVSYDISPLFHYIQSEHYASFSVTSRKFFSR